MACPAPFPTLPLNDLLNVPSTGPPFWSVLPWLLRSPHITPTLMGPSSSRSPARPCSGLCILLSPPNALRHPVLQVTSCGSRHRKVGPSTSRSLKSGAWAVPWCCFIGLECEHLCPSTAGQQAPRPEPAGFILGPGLGLSVRHILRMTHWGPGSAVLLHFCYLFPKTMCASLFF